MNASLFNVTQLEDVITLVTISTNETILVSTTEMLTDVSLSANKESTSVIKEDNSSSTVTVVVVSSVFLGISLAAVGLWFVRRRNFWKQSVFSTLSRN